MIDTNAILEMLRAGQSPDDVAANITSSLNSALEQYNAEEAAKATAASQKEEELNDLAEIIAEAINDYLRVATGYEVGDALPVKEIRATIDAIVPFYATLMQIEEKVEKKNAAVPVRNSKNPSDAEVDKILHDFLAHIIH